MITLKKHRRGFTLIELLIVIAIIGLLASIVMGAVGTARNKGKNAKVKAQLASLREAAEIYYDTNGYYGSTASDDCITSDFFSDPTLSLLVASNNYPAGATLSCHTDGTNYAVSALLPGSTGGVAWCVDGTGASRQIPANLSVGAVTCP